MAYIAVAVVINATGRSGIRSLYLTPQLVMLQLDQISGQKRWDGGVEPRSGFSVWL